MNWKRWPYWIRGGIIGFVLAIIHIFLVFAGIDVAPISCLDLSTTLEIRGGVSIACKIIFPGSDFDRTGIIFLLGWFVYGSILGWLYGKIKGKAKMKDQISKI